MPTRGNILNPYKQTKAKRGRPVGSIGTRTREWVAKCEELLAQLGCNPIEGMALIAIGDVVRLGYMTEEELREPARFDKHGHVIRQSGMERALEYVPPGIRLMAYKELAQYVYSKRVAVQHSNPDGTPLQAAVVVHLPPNGR